MAMDIELRNALGALTAQVSELTKQTKTFDGALASAMDKGAKGAGGLADSTRRARSEMTMVEQVSTRIGKAWTSQVFSLAAGYVGVTSLFNGVTDQINKAIDRAESRAKSVRDFADKSRPAAPPAMLPELRKAIRGTALSVAPEQQAGALKSYLEAGGTPTEGAVGRLGQVVNASYLLGFEGDDLAKRYAKLQQMGVPNPEDVIYQMTKDGKAGEIDKLKPGAARAAGQRSGGAWNRAVQRSQVMAPEDFEAWANRTRAAQQANADLEAGIARSNNDARWRILEGQVGGRIPTVTGGRQGTLGSVPGPFGTRISIGSDALLRRQFNGMSNSEIEAWVDDRIRGAGVMPADMLELLPQPVQSRAAPVEPGQPSPAVPAPIVPPPHWSRTVPQAVAPPSTRPPVFQMELVRDTRPVPVNAGD